MSVLRARSNDAVLGVFTGGTDRRAATHATAVTARNTKHQAVRHVVLGLAIQERQLTARNVVSREMMHDINLNFFYVLCPLRLLAVLAQGQSRLIVTKHVQWPL